MGEEKIQGIIVEEMADKGFEVILGSKRDANFGPVIVFGMGGTYVEVFKDVAFRVAPLRELGVKNLINGIKASKLLHGYRGKPVDIPRIEECLGRLSQLVVDFPEIEEVDINPLIVYPAGNGARVADGRIILAKPKKN